MHRTPAFALALVLPLALAAGCAKEDAGDTAQASKNAEPAAAAAEAEPPAEPSVPARGGDGPFAAYDLGAPLEALQGSWVVGGDTLGQKVAWKVEGDRLTAFDGTSETVRTLSMESPCSVKASAPSSGVSTYYTFAVDGGTLYKGLGAAGVRIGDDVVACAGGKTYVLSGDTCTAWKSFFGDWESSSAECSLDGDTLTVEGRALTAVGDAFVDAQMKGNVAEPADDFEAARAAL